MTKGMSMENLFRGQLLSLRNFDPVFFYGLFVFWRPGIRKKIEYRLWRQLHQKVDLFQMKYASTRMLTCGVVGTALRLYTQRSRTGSWYNRNSLTKDLQCLEPKDKNARQCIFINESDIAHLWREFFSGNPDTLWSCPVAYGWFFSMHDPWS